MRKYKRLLPLFLALLLAACLSAKAAPAGKQALDLPDYTETECEWDEKGNLISETVYDLNGAPAINNRGFTRAEYTYDEKGNLLTESFFDLDSEPVNTDGGYAKAVFSYA